MKVSVIIPCFNEAGRLKKEPFLKLLQSSLATIELIFIDDGSTDNTVALLQEIRQMNRQQVIVISYPENKGKAHAVYKGMQHALCNSHSNYIGYLDADLSTNIQEFLRLVAITGQEQADYAFGSRIKMLNHHITRTLVRHICGRIVTTIIDSRYRLYIYDTQCGAKLFTPAIAKLITNTPFTTRWLFDVEIFLRIRAAKIPAKGLEIPLKEWTHMPNSKITLLSLPLVCRELYQLTNRYKKLQ